MLELSIHLDARAYTETLHIDFLWIDTERRYASAVVANHMGTFRDLQTSAMFIVFDSNNETAFLRRGDRVVGSGLPTTRTSRSSSRSIS